MEHSYIEENNIVDLYVMRKLARPDREEFEEHFVDCEQCQDQIEVARDLHAGMQAEGREKEHASPPRPVDSRWSRVLALAAGLFIAGVPAAWFAAQSVRTRYALDTARATASEWRQRYEEQAARVRTPEFPGTIPVFQLSAGRGGAGSAGPVVTIRLPDRPQPIVVLLENPITPEYPNYRVTIYAAGGTRIWQASGLKQTSTDVLAFSVSSDLIPPGDHSITLEGVSRDGRYEPVGKFTFRAIRTK